MTKFIVISGKKGHGKNYFSSILVEYLTTFGKTVKETAFAAPIKNFCNDVFGFSYEDMNSQDGKNKKSHLRWSDIFKDISKDNKKFHSNGDKKICLVCAAMSSDDEKPISDEFMTIREVLQIIGTDVWRNRFYDNIWCEAPFRKQHSEDFVIITDCRFPNELQVAKNNNATIFRVFNPNISSTDTHISEIALDHHHWEKNELFINDVEGKQKILEFIKNAILI